MAKTRLDALRTKAKLLQKSKKNSAKPILLKEAYAIIAKAAGFNSWQDMKAVLEVNEIFCPHGHSAIWKTWYASYEEAVAELSRCDGYLLPYQKDFFICNADYIHFLGIEVSDQDLLLVGRNWVQPQNKLAYETLLKKIKNRF